MSTTADEEPRRVWYASYGSNLCEERFSCYLSGGRPFGSSSDHPRARDDHPARRAVALEMPYPLYFAGVSKAWGGSPAFIDATTPSGRTLGRGYLITWEQFEDVVAQENARSSGPLAIGDEELEAGFSRQIGPGRYELLVCTGRREGVPIVTFTSPWAIAEAEIGAPAPAYLAMLIGGLREAHGLSDEVLVGYLGSAPGCSPEQVLAALPLAARQRVVSHERH
jgi:hypothetical protein